MRGGYTFHGAMVSGDRPFDLCAPVQHLVPHELGLPVLENVLWSYRAGDLCSEFYDIALLLTDNFFFLNRSFHNGEVFPLHFRSGCFS